MKKTLLNLLKLTVSVTILAVLVHRVLTDDPETFDNLWDKPKHWGYLAVAWCAIFTSVVVTIVRWYWLVRALDMPFSIRDAFRLGFLGYLLNLVSLGSVGGDFFKAVFIAREQPGKRTEAVATIVVDRVLGMLALFIVASGAILLTDLSQFGQDIVEFGRITLGVTALLALGMFVLLLPGWHDSRPMRRLRRLPKVGLLVGKLVDAVYVYRQRRRVLYLSIFISMIAHCGNVFAFYCIAQGLPEQAPGLVAHFIIIPLALVSGAIPLPGGGLGAFEFVTEELYRLLGAAGLGLLVALTYRAITVTIAAIGAVVYLLSRREMSGMIEQAEQLEEQVEEAEPLSASDGEPTVP